ncbi:hypothetical protein LOAG_15169 [Loa loa]|uniref:Uncharacterized protein n=1 Tax=Loa loa TaxID=7209 RepID=A0A1S0TGG1_LOALO|nr:hypothetical protein LOAG_15169 [Loa loa]EFO13359.1 hypothetical protein LOAG_15169 [Loa loa]
MKYEIINSTQKTIAHTKVLTNYGNYVKALSYFPIEYIEDEYMGTFRKETAKFPISFYGIINCTVFVIMKFEDFEKVNLEGSGKHFDIILIWNIMEYKIECFV